MKHEEVVVFLKNVLKIPVIETKNYYLMPTVCHNSDIDSASYKLYLYKNEKNDNPIFTCYTECGDSFNIYELIKRYFEVRGEMYTFGQAYKLFHGVAYRATHKEVVKEEIEIIKNEFQNPLEIRLPEYADGILEVFREPDQMHPWALEGIEVSSLRQFGIGFSASYNGVTIPHRDFRGNLVGLRLRTFDEEKLKIAKYMPMLVNNIYYRHPTSLNFFGIFQNQRAIRKAKKAIIVEGEKSVLQAESMWGRENNITLAVCGSSISSWQVNMLIYYLGVESVTIAFDKEYSNFSEAFDYIEGIKEQVKTLRNFAQVGVLVDETNTFGLKESPFDRSISDYNKMKTIYL